MPHSTFRTLLVLGALLALGTTPAFAQFGVGVAYGTDTSIGGQLSFYRPIEIGGVSVRGGGDVMVYLPESVGAAGFEVDYMYFEVNLNSHYILLDNESVRAYGLGGLNYSYISVSSDFGTAVGGGDTGVNLGGGAEMNVGLGRVYAEAKYNLGGFSQVGLTAGLRFGGD